MGGQKTFGENQEVTQPIIGEYHVLTHLDVYDSPECGRLATQARANRHLLILSDAVNVGARGTVKVRLCEDDYPGWLKVQDLQQLRMCANPYRARRMNREEICTRLPDVVSFTKDAMAQPNSYLWGGTVGPNFDCSGLVQAAFASVGIWLPRDAYQQEDFIHPVAVHDVERGDLIFFGSEERATHVGLYIGEGEYIHSSGRDHGRDGVGINRLSPPREEISEWLFQKLRGAGRVMESYQPRGTRLT
ncbi:MAG: C40 family peptidase [Candidatus Poribacteria bacterium]|nr:C40 family peptidase [Candidatus Poribacteria bacterium]